MARPFGRSYLPIEALAHGGSSSPGSGSTLVLDSIHDRGFAYDDGHPRSLLSHSIEARSLDRRPLVIDVAQPTIASLTTIVA